MKAVLHGLATLALVVVTAVCVLVQVDHLDAALDVISSRAVAAK
jgi:hypothetical protein